MTTEENVLHLLSEDMSREDAESCVEYLISNHRGHYDDSDHIRSIFKKSIDEGMSPHQGYGKAKRYIIDVYLRD